MDRPIPPPAEDYKGRPFVPNGNSIKSRTKFASRKFTLTALMVALSYLLAWFKPDMMTGQILFNFWMVLAGLYFGGNVVEVIAMKKGK